MKWVLMTPGDAHPAAGDLLDAQRVGQQRLAQPVVLLGDRQPEDPELLEPVDDLLRVLVRVLELGRDRKDLLVHERADGLEDLGLVVGEVLGLAEAAHAGVLPGLTCGVGGYRRVSPMRARGRYERRPHSAHPSRSAAPDRRRRRGASPPAGGLAGGRVRSPGQPAYVGHHRRDRRRRPPSTSSASVTLSGCRRSASVRAAVRRSSTSPITSYPPLDDLVDGSGRRGPASASTRSAEGQNFSPPRGTSLPWAR